MTGILPDIICVSSVTVQNTRIMKCDREMFKSDYMMHNSLNSCIDYLVIKYISIIKQRKLHISFLYPNFGTGTISLMSGTN